MKPRLGINKNCNNCGKEFYIPQYRADTSKFCSNECFKYGQHNKKFRKCVGCGIDFIVTKSRDQKKYCSRECVNNKLAINRQTSKQRRASRNILANEKRGNNTSRNLRNWLSKLIKFECCVCNYDEYDFCIDVHHIDEDCNNNTISNLSLLCCMCHKKYHKKIIHDSYIKSVKQQFKLLEELKYG